MILSLRVAPLVIPFQRVPAVGYHEVITGVTPRQSFQPRLACGSCAACAPASAKTVGVPATAGVSFSGLTPGVVPTALIPPARQTTPGTVGRLLLQTASPPSVSGYRGTAAGRTHRGSFRKTWANIPRLFVYPFVLDGGLFVNFLQILSRHRCRRNQHRSKSGTILARRLRNS